MLLKSKCRASIVAQIKYVNWEINGFVGKMELFIKIRIMHASLH